MIERLLTRDSGSLVARRARRPGQKAARDAQLLGARWSRGPNPLERMSWPELREEICGGQR
ncbi:MAG: hypothetical protein ACK6DP_01710 [Gemmatimonas sp.]|uniref:hypothetical protein n=1 Tax=Gemmatimonas sp. TaxID=1962908 RepID=UPI00391FB7CE|nr:hypothetical protein [Gemmatimonadota bacterium]